MKMRLDKLLSNMGFGSRKEIKTLVRSGAVKVGGKPAADPGMAVDPENEDEAVTVNGAAVSYRPFVYIMMNKPAGVISATEDAHGMECAVDLVGEEYSMYELKPAGRLDRDTEGFLLLTNDGNYIHDVISPKKHVFKEYYAELAGVAGEADAGKVARGLKLSDGTECLPGKMEILRADPPAGTSAVRLCIREGRFHQVKRMMQALGHEVTYLKRLAIGGVRLDGALAPGEYRELTEDEKRSITGESLEEE